MYKRQGQLTVSIPADETVEWLDGAMSLTMHGLTWDNPRSEGDDEWLRAHPVDTPVVTLAEAVRTFGTWPRLEGFVQDGRYNYAGALARANADLDAFSEPLVTADWDTDDLNAQPGRQQVINLTGASVVSTTVTITRVTVSFPLRTERPRRSCTGGDVKASTFLDVVVTDLS